MPLRVLAVLLIALLGAGRAAAAAFPAQVLAIVVPFPAGGPSDVVARIVGQSLAKTTGSNLIVENVGGASGTIGSARAARAAPDGHTLLLHHVGMATAAAVYPELRYDPVADFEPIGLVIDVPMTLIGRKDLPAANLQELIAYVKANRESLSLGNAGIGGSSHLCGMLFQKTIGAELTAIPYRGGDQSLNDVVGGRVDLLCSQITNTSPQIRAGAVRAYGVASAHRAAALPDVPTLQEAGLPDFEVTTWYGLYAPHGTPEPIVSRLAAALQSALEDPDVKRLLAGIGAEPVSRERATPAALRAQLQSEIERWGPILRAAGRYAE